MINTLPKPVLIALLYRLTILHLASRIIPTIGVDTWEPEEGADDGWTDCPVSLCTGVTQLSLRLFTDVDATRVLLTYRQLIFITVYSQLLCMFYVFG